MSTAIEPRPDMPWLGTLSYDGVEFGNGTKTLGVNIVPVENSSGSGTMYNRFTFKFETTLGGGPTGEPVTELRRLLTKPGKAFRYEDRGMGRFNVNVAGGNAKDVAWGPKCREVGFEPLGGGNSCKLTWTLEVAIVDCDDAVHEFALMEHEESVSYAIDEFGWCTRTVTGHLMIPQNRIGDGTRLKDSPDYYLDKIIPPLVLGFRRTFGPRTINEARTRLDYSYSDKQMGKNYPPPGVVKIDAGESMVSSVGGLAVWTATINATYYLAADAPDPRVCLSHFVGTLCKSRIDALAKSIGQNSKSITPVSFQMGEPSIYETPVRATFSFQFMFNRDLGKALGANGLWEPIPGSDWRKWANSLSGSAFNPRGSAGMVLDVGEERLTSLCNAGHVNSLRSGGGVSELRTGVPLPNQVTVKKLVDAIAPKPEKDESWIYYVNELVWEADSGSILTRLLPSKILKGAEDVFGAVEDALGRGYDAISSPTKTVLEAVGQPPASTSVSAGVFNAGNFINNSLQNNSTPPSGGRRVRPSSYVFLRGKAARTGTPVPRPTLADVGGVKPVPADRLDRGEGFGQQVTFLAGSHPVYLARWNFRFYLPEEPNEVVPVPPNPMVKTG